MPTKEDRQRATIAAIDRADERRIWWKANAERVRPIIKKVLMVQHFKEQQALLRKGK